MSAQAPIGGTEYKAADQLRTALDDMTGVLTGDREHFWNKDHSTHPGMHISCDDKRPGDQTEKSGPGAGSKSGPAGGAGGAFAV